jgi:hypothetical protein
MIIAPWRHLTWGVRWSTCCSHAGHSAETSGRGSWEEAGRALRSSTPLPRVKGGARGWRVALGPDGMLQGCSGPPASPQVLHGLGQRCTAVTGHLVTARE